MTSLLWNMSAFLLCLLLAWQDLQDLTYDRMVRLVLFT